VKVHIIGVSVMWNSLVSRCCVLDVCGHCTAYLYSETESEYRFLMSTLFMSLVSITSLAVSCG